ncbi:MAG TPA: carboxypeptidase regulatory-like domain-containing protein [Streptosporangiaceae bacterium]
MRATMRATSGLAAATLFTLSLAGIAPAASASTGHASGVAARTAASHAHPAVKKSLPVHGVSGKRHATHRACPATKAGFMECLSIVRTDVKGHKGLFPADTTPAGYGPGNLQSAYSLPSSTAGSGETVGIVDAFDDPNAEADLAVYRSQFGLAPCTSASGCFTRVAQDGSTNFPPTDPSAGWEEEESLDVDMVSAICPNCHIILVEANDNSTQNLGTAVDEAVTLGAKYVSNSYGGSEDPSETTFDSQFYQHPGVAVTASTGDSGFGPQYPAASQFVTAVGGTTLTQDSGVPRGWSETAWSGAGSGCSSFEAKPAWQTDTGCSNRTEADVSAEADPNTGVAFYDTFGGVGGWGVVGGTSVSSPIIASTFALAGTPVAGTYPSSYPYADTADLFDVTSGSNGSCSPAYLCTAGPGYDGPTGLGTPDGVAAFTTGPHGTVTGKVGSSATGDPLAGAQVSVGTDSTTTNSSGVYSISVPVGSYTVTAQDFGFKTVTDTGVSVTDGGTTTENFALATAPSVTLTGTVTDGSGQGWPLYANVSVPGTTASTFTNPATGQYQLTLPADATYSVQVNSAYPGYQQAAKSVKLAGTSKVSDFKVKVDAQACDALGYHFKDTGSTQTFGATTTPAGWHVISPNNQPGWAFNNPAGQANNTGGTGNFAVVNSSFYGPGAAQNTALRGPDVDMTKFKTPVLQFSTDLAGWFNSASKVNISTDGGQTWTTVWSNSGFSGMPGPATVTVPLPAAAGQAKVLVRFNYTGADSQYWAVDNVFLGNQACVPAHGGMVEGRVTDGNTGGGVNAATVASVSSPGQTGVSAPTPNDPNMNGGFYFLFSPGTGSQKFTATASNYVAGSTTVNVQPKFATTANITLQAGQLSVTPGSLSATQRMGQSTTEPLTFSNTGKAPVDVKLFEQPGSFTLQGHLAGAPVERVKGTFSPLSAIKNAAAVKRSEARIRPSRPGVTPADSPWVNLANFPSTVMDNSAAADTTTGNVYSIGGFDGSTNVSGGFVYNPATQAWTAIASMANAREAPSVAFIGGKLYAVGGWDNSGNPVAALEIYDPGSDTWSTGASVPTALAGSSVAVFDGKMYVIGGCDALNCGFTNVQIYDPSTNSWSSGAAYPTPIAWASCGGLNADIYCAGGTTGSTTDTSAAYAYSPATNSWSQVASLPIDLWASGYAAANGKLLVSGGVTNGFNTVTNQGFSYDPGSNSWTALPNANNTDYRAGSACGFDRIGGSTVGFTPQNFVEQLPGFSSCGVTNVPWLKENHSSFTLQPGASMTVKVTMNAASKSVSQPGVYTAGLAIVQNTPYQVPQVGVTMTAKPPVTWGEIAGKVTGLACHGPAAPLAGATLQINTWAASFTLKTGSDGSYALWLDVRNNPLQLIAAMDGWQPQTATATITALKKATVNFALKNDNRCS